MALMTSRLGKHSKSFLSSRITSNPNKWPSFLLNHDGVSTLNLSTTAATATATATNNRPSHEKVEGVWIFHRHGDRSPGRPLVAEHMYEAESQFWRTKIPPTDRSYYHAMCEKYPTNIHESNNN